MNKYKYILKSILVLFIPLTITTIITSTLNYFNIISFKTLYVLMLIITIFSFALSGSYLAKHSEKKGILQGLLMGLINTSIFLILSLITSKVTLFTLLYYLILIMSSITGGIIGINKNQKLTK